MLQMILDNTGFLLKKTIQNTFFSGYKVTPAVTSCFHVFSFCTVQ